MRYIMITYHMEKIDPELGTATETAETCIRLPMRSELADLVLFRTHMTRSENLPGRDR